MTALKPLSWALILSAVTGIAAAQDAPPVPPATAPTPARPAPAAPAAGPKATTSSAQIDAGEPRANAAPSAGGVPAAPPAASPGVSSPPRSAPRTVAPGRTPSAAGQKAPGGADRLNLGTATVTGDREQPKVMYIVPWKSSNIGDLSGKPMNSLLDEALAPVDRDEFKRQVAYYDALKEDTQNGASSPAKQVEK